MKLRFLLFPLFILFCGLVVAVSIICEAGDEVLEKLLGD